ncbi:MAG TPA: IclR family transcriptional regulator [Fervidobacterium sp.]|nr:IclR family transcriptional regulator [Fervidobacterium sp.]
MKKKLSDPSLQVKDNNVGAYTVKALADGLSILLLFDEDRTDLTLKEIEDQLNYGKSRTFRMLKTLVLMGFLRVTSPRPTYGLGPSALSLGLRCMKGIDIPDIARPILSELASSTQETAILTMLCGEESIVICKEDSPLSVRMAAEVGAKGCLYAGASSVPLLAFASEDVKSKFLSGMVEMERFTEKTAMTQSQVLELIDTVHRLGYHVSKGEVEEGLMAVGAPILNHAGEARFCVSVCGPQFRMQDREGFIIEEVVSASRKLSNVLIW